MPVMKASRVMFGFRVCLAGGTITDQDVGRTGPTGSRSLPSRLKFHSYRPESKWFCRV